VFRIRADRGTAFSTNAFLAKPIIRCPIGVFVTIRIRNNMEFTGLPLPRCFVFITPSCRKTKAAVTIVFFFWRRYAISKNLFKDIHQVFLGELA